MPMQFTPTEKGVRNVAVADHAGYSARVVTGYDASIDLYRVHVYLGKQGDDGQEASTFKKFDTSNLTAKNEVDGFEQGFAIAESAIDAMLKGLPDTPPSA